MRRALNKASLIIIAVVALGLVGVWGWLVQSLPRTDGEVQMTGIDAPLNIKRTEHGLVTVQADNWRDAWFGIGFAHAQDRLWQVESLRRFALGTLSEVIGEATLDLDIAQRRLNLDALARAQFEVLDAGTQTALRAYADGINAFVNNHDTPLPPEFLVLQFRPAPWAPHHGLLWGRLMAYQLSGRWRDDLARESYLDSIDIEKLRVLWPALAKEAAARSDVAPNATRFSALPPRTLPHPKGASNAWALAPGKSTSGGALLAGDPHLGLSLPGTWYMARLEVGMEWVEGATAPGVPFVVLGRTQSLAWSMTSNEADLQDVVRIKAANVDRRIPQTVRVKDGTPQDITLMFSKAAPVIAGTVLDGIGDDGIALLATALSVDDTSPDALARLNRARTIAGGIDALARFRAPFMNVFLADTQGGIAAVHAGDVPRRDGYSGRLPLQPGDVRWLAVNAANRLSAIRNPSGGVLSNANERTLGLDDLRFPLDGDWPAPVRADRLNQLLGAAETFSMDDLQTMQGDVVDITATAWTPTLQGLSLSGAAFKAREKLLAWDGSMNRDAAAPLIYATFLAALKRAIFADELKGAFGVLKLPGPDELRKMLADENIWCDQAKTQLRRESCRPLAQSAFSDAVMILVESHGGDVDDWRWGDAHVAYFDHKLLGRLPFVGGLFDLRIETPGGDRTLNRGASPRNAGFNGAFPHVHGAGFRAVHDMAGAPSRYIAVPGQSGNPFSDHYSDLMELWRDQTYVGFDAPVVSTLRILPQNK
tara:strand:- start:3020 stop:5311 length:2292 start_codon:yes stop_codon:yes gene_type:complete